MKKSQLIESMASQGSITRVRAELVVNCILESMTAALKRDEGIEIRGFGSFTVRSYKSYEGRNPRSGTVVNVPAKRLPYFKVGLELRQMLNAGLHLGAVSDDG